MWESPLQIFTAHNKTVYIIAYLSGGEKVCFWQGKRLLPEKFCPMQAKTRFEQKETTL